MGGITHIAIEVGVATPKAERVYGFATQAITDEALQVGGEARISSVLSSLNFKKVVFKLTPNIIHTIQNLHINHVII